MNASDTRMKSEGTTMTIPWRTEHEERRGLMADDVRVANYLLLRRGFLWTGPKGCYLYGRRLAEATDGGECAVSSLTPLRTSSFQTFGKESCIEELLSQQMWFECLDIRQEVRGEASNTANLTIRMTIRMA